MTRENSTAECQACCAASEKKYDCNFCMCKGCHFCGGNLAQGAMTTVVAPSVSAASNSIECPLGVSVEVLQSWGGNSPNRGFRPEVVVQQWQRDMLFTLRWAGDSPSRSVENRLVVTQRRPGRKNTYCDPNFDRYRTHTPHNTHTKHGSWSATARTRKKSEK